MEILDGTVELRTSDECTVYSLDTNGQRQNIPVEQVIHVGKDGCREIHFSAPSPILEILTC